MTQGLDQSNPRVSTSPTPGSRPVDSCDKGEKMKKYTEGQKHNMEELREIIHALRDKDEGCSWDSVQTHESLEKCLRDEFRFNSSTRN